MPEPYLGSPSGTIEILRKYNISARKKFGQNFLIDDGVLSATVDAAELTPEDAVLEIGPGIGTLTQYLAASAGHVVDRPEPSPCPCGHALRLRQR